MHRRAARRALTLRDAEALADAIGAEAVQTVTDNHRLTDNVHADGARQIAVYQLFRQPNCGIGHCLDTLGECGIERVADLSILDGDDLEGLGLEPNSRSIAVDSCGLLHRFSFYLPRLSTRCRIR